MQNQDRDDIDIEKNRIIEAQSQAQAVCVGMSLVRYEKA